jgi:hypothetical protein
MGRPKLRPGLNSTSQRECAWWLAQGYTKEQAAKKAGLPTPSRLSALTRTAEFAADLRAALQDHMTVDLAPKAVRILDEIMSDTNMNGRVRVDAAKALLDRAGFTARPFQDGSPFDDELCQMTREALARFIVEGEREIERRKMITVGAIEVEPKKASSVEEVVSLID